MILTIAVIKGGTGKSTTAAALAQAAAADGKKVLAVDLDPQANFTFSIGADQNAPGSYDLLHGAEAAQLIQHTAQGIDTIAANHDLATEQTRTGSAKRLQEAIEPLKKKYDFVFIDTPPTIGELTSNALQASTGLLIPLETDSNSIQGMNDIVFIAREMQRSNPALRITGTIVTRYDARPKLNRYLLEDIENQAFTIGAPLLAVIRSGVAIREAQAMQQSIFDYAPRSKPAQDYKKLYDIIKGRRHGK